MNTIIVFSFFMLILAGMAAIGLYAANELLDLQIFKKTHKKKSTQIIVQKENKPQAQTEEKTEQTSDPKPIKKEINEYDQMVEDLRKSTNWNVCYNRKELFTQNEKRFYPQIANWASKKGYIAMGKIRLADLLDRRPDKKWNKALFEKISQKHLDYVICNQELEPVLIIEIQDNSHQTPEAMKKDAFKKITLESCGYKLLQIYDVNEEILDRAISS